MSARASAKRAELEQNTADLQDLVLQLRKLVVREAEPVACRLDDGAQAHAGIERGDHLLGVGRRVDRLLHPVGELDATLDVDRTSPLRFELAFEQDGHRDGDAGLEQTTRMAELLERMPVLERPLNLVSRLVQILLVHRIQTNRPWSFSSPVQQDGSFADPAYAQPLEV